MSRTPRSASPPVKWCPFHGTREFADVALRCDGHVLHCAAGAGALDVMDVGGRRVTLEDGPNRQSPIPSVQRTQSTLASHSAVPRETNVTGMNANRVIQTAAQRTQGLLGRPFFSKSLHFIFENYYIM